MNAVAYMLWMWLFPGICKHFTTQRNLTFGVLGVFWVFLFKRTVKKSLFLQCALLLIWLLLMQGFQVLKRYHKGRGNAFYIYKSFCLEDRSFCQKYSVGFKG